MIRAAGFTSSGADPLEQPVQLESRSIRRECVDHFVVLGEAHLRRILRAYARYYNEIRTHHRWIKMLRSLARFSGPDSLVHARSLADFITTTSGFRFSVHTAVLLAARSIGVDLLRLGTSCGKSHSANPGRVI